MPPTKSEMSWTVRKSKRERPAQESRPTKRQRLSAPERLNQQTLTQKPFLLPPQPGLDEDEMETIEPYQPKAEIPNELSKSMSNSNQQTLTQIRFPPRQVSAFNENGDQLLQEAKEEEPRKPVEAKPKSNRPKKKKSKLQLNTITQMDYLAPKRPWDDDGILDNQDLHPIAVYGDKNGDVTETIKSNDLEGSARRSGKKRKVGAGSGVDDVGQKGRRRTRGENAEKQGGDQDDVDADATILGTSKICVVSPRRTRSKRASEIPTKETKTTSAQKQSPVIRARAGKENNPPRMRDPLLIPETPQKKRDFIPSSQTPDSVPMSRIKRLACTPTAIDRSPLQERSLNLTGISSLRLKAPFDTGLSMTSRSPKKRKICVLRYGPGRSARGYVSHSEDLESAFRPVQPELPALPEIPFQHGRAQNSTGATIMSVPPQGPTNTELEIPESSQCLQNEIISSSQPSKEESSEISETDQGLRSCPTVSSSTHLQLLAEELATPRAETGSSRDRRVAFDQTELMRDELVQDHGCSGEQESHYSHQPSSGTLYLHSRTSALGLHAPIRRLGPSVTTISDSEDEEDDILGQESITAQPTPRASENLPPPDPANSSTFSHPTDSITLPSQILPPISTKPLNDLPPPPPPFFPSSPNPYNSTAPAAHTQYSIHPASLPRPSQVSTQAATQASWLQPASSILPRPPGLPTQFTRNQDQSTSSPLHVLLSSNTSAEHVTIQIKDESSPIMLGNVNSELRRGADESRWQNRRYKRADAGGIGNGAHDDDNNNIPSSSIEGQDEDLDPKSSPAPRLPSPHPHAYPYDEVYNHVYNHHDSDEEIVEDNGYDHDCDGEEQDDEDAGEAEEKEEKEENNPPRSHSRSGYYLPASLLESIPGPPGEWLAAAGRAGWEEEDLNVI